MIKGHYWFMHMKLFLSVFLVFSTVMLGGCAHKRMSVLDDDLIESATVTGFDMQHIRIFGDVDGQEFAKAGFSDTAPIKTVRSRSGKLSQHFLVLSGGGPNGAYGAGLLNGWTESGRRPEFSLVSGVSTGAIIAPFAFLGPEYDYRLTEFYTQYSTDDLVRKNVLSGLLGGSSVASSEPLAKLIVKFITPEILAEIAREYDKGRYLLIGTTNLDAKRPVIWNMGAIAKIGTDEALHLFRKVIRASLSIPVAFEPILFNVNVNGKQAQELHVDGGTTDNAILLPKQLKLASVAGKIDRKVYVVINGSLKPKPSIVKPSTYGVALNSLDTLLLQQSRGDVLKVYNYSRANGIDFNLLDIPESFDEEADEAFDTVYMKALYDVGYEIGMNSGPWKKDFVD